MAGLQYVSNLRLRKKGAICPNGVETNVGFGVGRICANDALSPKTSTADRMLGKEEWVGY